MLTSHIIRVAVEAALAEDAPYGDITCETTIPADETGSAHLTARERGVMSGIAVFTAAFTGLHYVRTGDEHVALFLHHEDEVGQCRRIAGTTCTRT